MTLPHRGPAAAALAVAFTLLAAPLFVGCGPDDATNAAPEPVATSPATVEQTPTETTASATESSSPPQEPGESTALAVLATLTVKGRAPMTGYDRNQFGPAWADADRNGCDQRSDRIAAVISNIVFKPGTNDCVALSGDLDDPYTGTVIHYVYGDGALVDIDHVVALGNAWATGAATWPFKMRVGIATDEMNLLPVDASANRQKGDGDAATWLPSNQPCRCEYVARQIAVKSKFGLWVTAPEKDAMERVLATCPDQKVPMDSGYPVEVPLNLSEPQDEPEDEFTASSGDGSLSYENCDAVRAAGADPIHAGDPGFNSHLDGDGDGIACE
jgi:hypothetical protein